ncbi:hypothetical protein I317_06011 [Kwoniella heveanensis CBS 569]|nr:hypothetical protein I317_06011 [Kwoniella heveanensis CBS 569]
MFTLSTAITIALGLGLSSTEVSAHRGCGGHEVAKRNPGGPVINSLAELRGLSKRQTTSTMDEASEAAISDPNQECTAYSYQPVVDVKSQFPTIWETASLVDGDTEASALFATINQTLNAKFPNATPKGTKAGDWSASASYNATDPDCWWTYKQCTTPAASLNIAADKTTVPEPETWGLAFDDGPNCSHNAFYDYLQNNGQKATMFYIGSNVLDWPLQAQRGHVDGHELCIHTWSHQYMTGMSNEEAFAELYYTQKAIKTVTGLTPTCWRPPFGDVDNRIRVIASGLNLTNYVWSDDSEDWRAFAAGSTVTEDDVTKNYQNVIAGVANGTYATHGPIVLTHEINNGTMQEFVSQYDSIKAAFKYIVPLASAFNITQPYAETNETYPDFMTYTNQSTSSSSSSSSTTSASGSNASGSSGSTTAASASKASGSTASDSKNSAASVSFGYSGVFASVALFIAGGAMLA